MINDLEDMLKTLDGKVGDLDLSKTNAHSLNAAKQLINLYHELLENAGTSKWFVPGTPFGIENCPKHKMFFDAGKKYHERMFMASNRCFSKGTRVWMADGSEKPIEDVLVGEEVLGFDKLKKVLVPVKVSDTFKGRCDYVRRYYTPVSNREVSATTDHPFLVRSQRTGNLNLVEADKLNTQKVCIPTKWDIEGVHPGFSEAVAKLLGLLVGDGYLGAFEDQFKLTNGSREVIEFASSVARWELGCNPREVSYGNYWDLYFPKAVFSNKKSELGKLLYKLGLAGTTSGNKFIPKEILLAPEGHVRAFVQGLLAADGHYKKGRILLHTTSPQLRQDFEKACLRLGTYTSYYTKKHPNPNHSDIYVISITGDRNLLKIGDSIHKKVILRGIDRQIDGSRAVALRGDKELLPEQDIYCITVDHPDHLFVANGYIVSNTGKSVGGCFELACHLTGNYPSWWNGKVFYKPIKAWACGSDAKATRDTVQKELLGPIGAWGTGMIPRELLGEAFNLSGVPQAVDTIRIKHSTGGESLLSFKNYEQKANAFYGTAMDVVWLDEECPDNIYNECLIRTMTTDGILLVTFTPLAGLTPLVVKFYANADLLGDAKPLAGVDNQNATAEESVYQARLANFKTSKAIVNAGWDDAPWLDDEAKARMLADTAPHLRQARSKGEPAMGSGNIYPIPLDEVLVAPFEIPDYYERLYGLDVGWNKTAALWAARNPDTDVIYIYDEHYVGGQPPAVHAEGIKARGRWIPGVIDPASRGKSQTDGSQLFQVYGHSGLGLDIFPAKNEVESGIVNTYNRFSSGKLKVFSTLKNFQREYTLYRRDLNGKIIKEHDHLMDTLRYIVNNLNRAVSKQVALGGASGGAYFGTKRYDI